MPVRLGGPTPGIFKTWGSLRSPLMYVTSSNSTWGGRRDAYSRTYPVTTGDAFPKQFIWESGSLFRWVRGGGSESGVQPYFTIDSVIGGEGDEDPPIYDSQFSIGFNFYASPNQVDDQDFAELIGEDLETDGGTFEITTDAHINGTYQTLESVPVDNRVQAIGKLDPV